MPPETSPTLIRLGYNPAFAPFAEETPEGPRGLVVDRITAACAAAGVTPEWWPVPLPELAAALAEGRVDLLAGTGAAPERAAAMDFSPPVVMTGGAWFALRGTDWPGPDALAEGLGRGRTVTTPAAGPLAGYIARHFPSLTLETCMDYADALDRVAAGQADAAALNLHVGRGHAEARHPGRFRLPADTFLEVALVLAAPKGDPGGLLARIAPHLPPPD